MSQFLHGRPTNEDEEIERFLESDSAEFDEERMKLGVQDGEDFQIQFGDDESFFQFDDDY